MQTKVILILGLILLLLITGCGGTNLLTGSSAAIPGDEAPVMYSEDNESYPGNEEEAGNLLTGLVK